MQEKSDISTYSTFSVISSYLKELLTKIYELTNALVEKTNELELAKAEIRRLKNLPKKPTIKASKLDDPIEGDQSKEGNKEEKEIKKRKGSDKENKQANLTIHDTVKVEAAEIPTDWKLVGYKSRIIQDVIIQANNISYELEIWESPDGTQRQVAKLPEHLENTHFGPVLKAYILHQYYECCVSQLIEDKELYHAEKASLLEKAIELAEELRTDDTGARHLAKNGYCNCISSDLFTYFTTSYSKSRINFLPAKYYDVLLASYQKGDCHFKDEASLVAYFKAHNFTAAYAIRTMTQGLLIGCLVENGFDPNIGIHSDGAGQFNLFVEAKKKAFWTLYQALKSYKRNPNEAVAQELTEQFEQMCESVVGFDALNKILASLKAKQSQLLLVLARPETSLHNNTTEGDIREYAKRRKLSAGTRSENGRKARDTFLSLKKTCRKLGVSFWEYLLDRLQNKNQIPPLAGLMAQKAAHS